MRQPLVEVRLWEEALADSRFFRTRYICNSANSEKIWKFSSVLSINFFVSHLHNCRSGQSLQLANVRLTPSSFASLNSPRWLETVTGDETRLTSQLISAPSLPTQPMKGCTTPPGSFTTGVFYVFYHRVLLRPTRIRTVKVLTRAYGFSFLSEKTRMSSHL